jgi:signal transduction histidine kinase
MTMTTVVTLSSGSPGAQAAQAALRDAGLGVVEVDTVQAAQAAARESRDTVVVCDGPSLAAMAKPMTGELPRDVRRVLAHELRTPLSAMAGWLHLLESGKLDEAGARRAIEKLRGNIDDQVRTIERYLGAQKERHD